MSGKDEQDYYDYVPETLRRSAEQQRDKRVVKLRAKTAAVAEQDWFAQAVFGLRFEPSDPEWPAVLKLLDGRDCEPTAIELNVETEFLDGAWFVWVQSNMRDMHYRATREQIEAAFA